MDSKYEKFFNAALKKFKIDSPADLKTDKEKKEFFDYVDNNYSAKNEQISTFNTKYNNKVVRLKEAIRLVVESELKKMRKK